MHILRNGIPMERRAFLSTTNKTLMLMEEIWKDVVGYEGLYQVSSLGRVKSLERLVKNDNKGGFRLIKEKILSFEYS